MPPRHRPPRLCPSPPLPVPASPARLADALGDTRAEIRALRTREAELRKALIDARPNGPVSGQRYSVTIRRGERRVFDRDALPDAILCDPRFWMTRASTTVVTRPNDSDGARATRPESAARGPERDLWGHETDIVLIEAF